MTTIYINNESFDYVAETLLALEEAYSTRASATRDSDDHFWASQSIEELNADLHCLFHFEEACEGL